MAVRQRTKPLDLGFDAQVSWAVDSDALVVSGGTDVDGHSQKLLAS